MERQIKIVWLLSIIAMFLITGGQVYWLRNQYRYMNEERAHELYNSILETARLNDSIRNLLPKKRFNQSNTFFYNIDEKFKGEGDVVYHLKLGAIRIDGDSAKGMNHSRTDNVTGPGKHIDRVYKADKGLGIRHLTPPNVIYKDSFRIEVPNMSIVNINSVISRYKLEMDVPFTLQRFDSLLALRLKDSSFTTRLEKSADSNYQWQPEMRVEGSLLNSHLLVCYPYNPLKHQQVFIDMEITPHILLVRMGWQLAGSLCLILLLTFCLLLQIKTILKQRRIDELRKSFVNTMIHELKRPVQALKMCVAFLSDKTMRVEEEAMDGVIRDSMSELDNLSGYLSKLRDMVRADDEHTQLSIRLFDIKDLLEKLIRLCQVPDGKQVSFDTHFSEETQVMADPVHIANIVSNLIENAVKYSGSVVHIKVDCRVHDHLLTLIVADDGIGISIVEQGRVFDKFYRGNNLPDPSLPGIGLGLSYVKLLVEAHQGTVSLSSQPDKGTEIKIDIPQ